MARQVEYYFIDGSARYPFGVYYVRVLDPGLPDLETLIISVESDYLVPGEAALIGYSTSVTIQGQSLYLNSGFISSISQYTKRSQNR